MTGVAYSQVPLFHGSIDEVHPTGCDGITVKEIERTGKVSILELGGFSKQLKRGWTGNLSDAEIADVQRRVDECPKWLMCLYTKMAIQRGFKYWVVALSEESNGKIIIGFPESQTENLAETLGPIFVNQFIRPMSVEVFTKLYGLTDDAESHRNR
jgi:hypothetical protein